MKKRILISILLIILFCLSLAVYFNSSIENGVISYTQDEKTFETTSPLFNRKISDLGLEATEFSTYATLSAENKYIIFGGIKTDTFTNFMYLGNLKTGALTKLAGNPVGPWQKEGLVITQNEKDVHTYKTETGKDTPIKTDEYIYDGTLSPDGRLFVFNTQKGIKLLELSTGLITSISNAQYDGAYSWFSDSKRILGYKENPLDNLYEAGKGRVLAIWNIETKQADTNLGIDMPSSSLRFSEWIVPDHIARINAGYDDGSFDYIVDLNRKFVTDLGETSGMLSNGIDISKSLKRVALLGMQYKDATIIENMAALYDENGKEIYKQTFADAQSRQAVNIVSDHELLYLRKEDETKTQTDIILFDFIANSEKVLYHSSDTSSSLLLSTDKTAWIFVTKNGILSQSLPER